MKARVRFLCVGFVLNTGCSLLFVPSVSTLPSERTQLAANECKPSSVWPTIDTISSVLSGVNVVVAAAADEDSKARWFGAPINRDAALALSASQLILYGASAAYGFVHLSRCQELRTEAESGKLPPSNEPPVDWVTE